MCGANPVLILEVLNFLVCRSLWETHYDLIRVAVPAAGSGWLKWLPVIETP